MVTKKLNFDGEAPGISSTANFIYQPVRVAPMSIKILSSDDAPGKELIAAFPNGE